MRLLTSRIGAFSYLLTTQAPDEMVKALSRHRVEHPCCLMQKIHFFAFGGVAKAAKWANAVIAGRFVLNDQGTGFRVEDGN